VGNRHPEISLPAAFDAFPRDSPEHGCHMASTVQLSATREMTTDEAIAAREGENPTAAGHTRVSIRHLYHAGLWAAIRAGWREGYNAEADHFIVSGALRVTAAASSLLCAERARAANSLSCYHALEQRPPRRPGRRSDITSNNCTAARPRFLIDAPAGPPCRALQHGRLLFRFRMDAERALEMARYRRQLRDARAQLLERVAAVLGDYARQQLRPHLLMRVFLSTRPSPDTPAAS